MVFRFSKRFAITQLQTILIVGIVFLILFFILAFPFYQAYKQKQTITKLKILQSELMQAARMYSMVSSGETLYNTDLPLADFVEKYFARFLDLEGFCKIDQSACWNQYLYTDMNNQKVYGKPVYSFELKNNIVIGFLQNKKGLIYSVVDIDGKVGANQLGKDVFILYFYDREHVPTICDASVYKNYNISDGLHWGGFDKCGIPHDVHTYQELISKDLPDGCNKKAQTFENGLGVGSACLAAIKVNNWTIDKSYPW